MLVIKPDPNNEQNEIKALNAFLDDQPCGFVRFHHHGYILVIDELTPLLDPASYTRSDYAVLDTIIRALGSYGLNHSCYYLQCENLALYPTLGTLRFSEKDGMMKSDLSKLLSHCCD